MERCNMQESRCRVDPETSCSISNRSHLVHHFIRTKLHSSSRKGRRSGQTSHRNTWKRPFSHQVRHDLIRDQSTLSRTIRTSVCISMYLHDLYTIELLGRVSRWWTKKRKLLLLKRTRISRIRNSKWRRIPSQATLLHARFHQVLEWLLICDQEVTKPSAFRARSDFLPNSIQIREESR